MPEVAGDAGFRRVAVRRPRIPDASPHLFVANARFDFSHDLIELSGGVVDALLRDRNRLSRPQSVVAKYEGGERRIASSNLSRSVALSRRTPWKSSESWANSSDLPMHQR